MIFTSFEFALFFLLVLVIRAGIRSAKADKWFLLLASYLFYMSWGAPLILVIIFTTAVDYSLGKRLDATEDPRWRKRLLTVSVFSNIAILLAFKYANFIVDNVVAALRLVGVQTSAIHLDIEVPPGVSYFTFASMSYVLDIYYQRTAACRSLLDYALFLAYFPKLLAGPIVRATRLLPQLRDRMFAKAEDIEVGLVYVMVGATKKLVISDQIAGHVNLIFGAPAQYDSFTLFQGAVGYAIQIYCDFSGYSDIAVGCARMLGVRLPENFRFPYSASSVSEFWRRWHITLSEWFRDYVFLPLQLATRRSRIVTSQTSINLMVTMLLCGLWHGAGWTFVLWGGMHGAALGINELWARANPVASYRYVYRMLWGGVSRFLTLGTVLVGWIVFRSESIHAARIYLTRMLSSNSEGLRLMSPYILPALVALVGVHLLFSKDSDWPEQLPRRSMAIRVAAYSCLLAPIVFLGASDTVPFIYFQF